MNSKPIIECVPNISEGRNSNLIHELIATIEAVKGVKLLHHDIGYDANRTVFTFAGSPEAVIEAAFQLAKKASERIDMQIHSGKHPRIGALDVCPLVPIANISMEETIILARALAKGIGEELNIPVYCYEEAAFIPQREKLENCRRGEYEGLNEKLLSPEWQPDFGPSTMNVRSGAAIVGAREFLGAYNVNLKTNSAEKATSIARIIRESGYIETINGIPTKIEGELKYVKAIGWYIEEFGFAQVSMNLTKLKETPLHIAFDAVCRIAKEMDIEVTGSELIGLIPLSSLVEAGKFFLTQQGFDVDDAPENELITLAIATMGLSQIEEFDPEKRIIDYLIREL